MSNPLLPTDYPDLDLIEKLWRDGHRAKGILAFIEENDMLPINMSALARYGQRRWNDKVTLQSPSTSVENLKETLETLDEAGLQVGKVSFANRKTYVWEKQEDGTNKQVPKDAFSQTIELLNGSNHNLNRATLPRISVQSTTRGTKDENIGLAISLPDMQIGYHRDNKGNLLTLQDESAIDISHQIIADLEATEGIDLIVMQGDNADFAEFGKYSVPPSLQGNTQVTIDRLGAEGATLRKLTPQAKIVYLEGNHEYRVNKTLTDKIPNLIGVSRSGEDKPVLDLSYLCRFDENNIEYLDGYPTNEFWASDGLRFIHGSTVKAAKGATAASVLVKGVNTVYGHLHRQELVWSVKTSRGKTENIFAGSAGTSCKTTGEVPSFHSSTRSNGMPATRPGIEEWQQGLMVIYYEKNGTRAWPEMVTIENGETIFRGKKYSATVDAEGKKIKRRRTKKELLLEE
ncbi:hypothetical protein EKI60_04750 [Candidatus Saccharibacteria bacterium]|nr:MAG: hypothetical protein EKI60_04750 [Candidatus Saccharibacteria bacterium]